MPKIVMHILNLIRAWEMKRPRFFLSLYIIGKLLLCLKYSIMSVKPRFD